jgi:hypothetical protein
MTIYFNIVLKYYNTEIVFKSKTVITGFKLLTVNEIELKHKLVFILKGILSFILISLRITIQSWITIFAQIKDENFFLIHHPKNGGSSYNHAQSSKNRANVFVINNTMKICLGWVVQLFRCVIFFCFITYHVTSFMATSVNRWMLFFSSRTVECFYTG